ncbi:hypothetical protein GLOIN_2v1769762 [Rhizophagus irregularis DAOM 181602=DAOM 197198]|uniref:Uncharacterized protein n=1 Tax=Rhizophagus irregularis (strain DAOM 181602 / DAOM 197198 / MUCL 43194) TaxID=747089 RepID=U9V6S8_RHIID|nr:hypothetical protein GLOIN_2v1769762 [Rhizophagus irregularis DAOM 181602=DAOM 197198]
MPLPVIMRVKLIAGLKRNLYFISSITLQAFPEIDIDSVNFRELNNGIIKADGDNKKSFSHYYFGKGARRSKFLMALVNRK